MKIKAPGWWMLPLLSIASLAATAGDLRLVEAVAKGNREAVRSLLKQHVDVNTPQPDGATALAWAAHLDDAETADLLIRAGANVNTANNYGATALSLACTDGNPAMVEKLLKAGADPKTALWTGETALMGCTRTGNVDAVKSLLSHGADVNAKETRQQQTALMWAVADKHLDVARVLIEHGADVHARSKSGFTPLMFAAQQGDLDSVQMLLAAGAKVNDSANDGLTPLLVASGSGHEALSVFLLGMGAEPNVADPNGITPLHYALQKGISSLRGVYSQSQESDEYYFRPNMPELVKVLLAHGANPNARIVGEPKLVNSRFPIYYLGGATPLVLAAATGDAGVMRMLVANGANPLQKTAGDTTALMLAASYGSVPAGRRVGRAADTERNALETIKLLIELGNDVNAVDCDGQSALHFAAYRGVNSVIQLLADNGAKLDAKDKWGQTPLSIAEGIIPKVPINRAKAPSEAHKTTADLLRKLSGDTTAPAVPVTRSSDVPSADPTPVATSGATQRTGATQ